MNYKSRIRAIEIKLSIGYEGLNFKNLFDPEFIYKGKEFDNLNEMYKRLNIVDPPECVTDKEKKILLEKHLLSIVGIVGEEMREKTIIEMRKSN